MPAIRSDDFPSHKGGIWVLFGLDCLREWSEALIMACLSVLTRRFVPFVRVIGLSVLFLSVMHGTPKMVVSS